MILIEHKDFSVLNASLIFKESEALLSLLLSEFSILKLFINEPCHEKTGFLHMRKQRRRSASR